jgi:hypothetical protein
MLAATGESKISRSHSYPEVGATPFDKGARCAERRAWRVDLVIGKNMRVEIEDAHGFLLPAQVASWTLCGSHGALVAEMLRQILCP